MDVYEVECDCGQRLSVELHEAGTRKNCPGCRGTVIVPDTVKLKQAAGDPYPLLSARQKIRWTLEAGEPPFDGRCHNGCQRPATRETQCRLEILEQRIVDDDQNGVFPTITGGLSFRAAATEEQWNTLFVPLWLCESCQQQFRRDRKRARWLGFCKQSGLLGIFGAFVAWVMVDPQQVAAMAGLFSVIGGVAWIARFQLTTQECPTTGTYLRRIRWMSELLDGEDEYRLTAAKAKKIRSPTIAKGPA